MPVLVIGVFPPPSTIAVTEQKLIHSLSNYPVPGITQGPG